MVPYIGTYGCIHEVRSRLVNIILRAQSHICSDIQGAPSQSGLLKKMEYCRQGIFNLAIHQEPVYAV